MTWAGLLSGLVFVGAIVASYVLTSRARSLVAAGGLVLVAGAVAACTIAHPDGSSSRVSAVIFFESLLVVAPAIAGLVQRGRRLVAVHVRDIGAPGSADAADELSRSAASVRAALLAGIHDLERAGVIDSIAAVASVEQVARRCLESVREVTHELRTSPSWTDSTESLTELGDRVDALVLGDAGPASTLGRRSLLTGRTGDGLLGLVSVLLCVVAIAESHNGWQALLAAGSTLPLMAARRHLTLAAALSFGSLAVLTAIAGGDPFSGAASVGLQMLAPFLAGLLLKIRRGAATLAACVVVAIVLPFAAGGGYPAAELVGTLAVQVACWVVGLGLRRSHASIVGLVDLASTRRSEGRAEQAIQLAAVRAELARELHDAAAHSMTIVVLHAAAARRVWHTDPVQRTKHVEVLRDTISMTLPQLSWLVGRVEPTSNDSPPDQRPATAGVDGLCRTAIAAGLRVRLSDTGLWADLGSLGALVVQEALTNAARHAPGSDVRVDAVPIDGQVCLSVVNGPARDQPVMSIGSGHGLAGLTERLAAVGGHLSATPMDDGGFRIQARIPVPTAVR